MIRRCINLLLRIVKKMVRPFIGRIYRITEKHVSLSVPELLAQWKRPYPTIKNSELGLAGSYNRLDFIVRYLAVENYYNMNDYGFSMYAKMQKARMGESYADEAAPRFKRLIESYQINGYQNTSEIILDRDLMLIDGSHRMALALFHNEPMISCRVSKEKSSTYYGIEWFIENDFSTDEIKLIVDKCNELLKEKRQDFSCVLWPPVQQYFEEITEKLGMLYEISDIQDYQLSDEIFRRAVDGIYSIDDIEKWKIEKKISGMMRYEKNVRIMQIRIENPEFRLKKQNNHTLSQVGERIKKMIRNEYRDKVDGYFYDIIIHTGDNHKQSKYITTLLKPHFSLREYLDYIGGYPYIAIKTQADYVDAEFPDTYPFGKDIDIMCLREDREKIIDDTIAFSMKKCMPDCNIRHITKDGKDKIRIEQENYLIFLFDISVELEGMQESFIRDSITNREKRKNYYVPRMWDELIYRMWEYHNDQSKKRHLEYIKENIDQWDPQAAISAMPAMKDEIMKLQENLFVE